MRNITIYLKKKKKVDFFFLPRQARVMAARWTECMELGLLVSARTNWKLRIPPIRPQMQQAENRIIYESDKVREALVNAHIQIYILIPKL